MSKPKQLAVTITAEGDDKGKVFVITKMHAEPLEDWAMRLFLGLARSKVEIPKDIESAGLAGIVRFGFSGAMSQLHIDELRPLMAEMMACVQCIPDPANPAFARPLVPNDIEEVTTRLKLRAEWVQLHTGFSIPGVTSTSTSMPGQKVGRGNMRSIRTSPEQ